MQLTMVREVPLDSAGEFCATNVENNGESAITTSPQKIRKTINSHAVEINKKNGESKQHKPDKNNAMPAIFFAPNRWENNPLKTLANAPEPMITNDQNETSKPARL